MIVLKINENYHTSSTCGYPCLVLIKTHKHWALVDNGKYQTHEVYPSKLRWNLRIHPIEKEHHFLNHNFQVRFVNLPGGTPRKFNIAPKNRQSQKETHLPTKTFFRGELLNFGGCTVWLKQQKTQPWSLCHQDPAPELMVTAARTPEEVAKSESVFDWRIN